MVNPPRPEWAIPWGIPHYKQIPPLEDFPETLLLTFSAHYGIINNRPSRPGTQLGCCFQGTISRPLRLNQ
jgi:hypothetical protein